MVHQAVVVPGRREGVDEGKYADHGGEHGRDPRQRLRGSPGCPDGTQRTAHAAGRGPPLRSHPQAKRQDAPRNPGGVEEPDHSQAEHQIAQGAQAQGEREHAAFEASEIRGGQEVEQFFAQAVSQHSRDRHEEEGEGEISQSHGARGVQVARGPGDAGEEDRGREQRPGQGAGQVSEGPAEGGHRAGILYPAQKAQQRGARHQAGLRALDGNGGDQLLVGCACESGFCRLLCQMAATRIAASRRTVIQPAAPSVRYCTTIGAMITETRLTTLIIGLSAGPAVSFIGSPTVSPTTLALWRSEPFPVLRTGSAGSSSMIFLALSKAPPALFMKTASSCPERMIPARKPPRASTWRSIPTRMGVITPRRARGTSSFCAAVVEMATAWR